MVVQNHAVTRNSNYPGIRCWARRGRWAPGTVVRDDHGAAPYHALETLWEVWGVGEGTVGEDTPHYRWVGDEVV